MATPHFYVITAQSNIHPGSGDVNYGIIDKLVQRDALTELPCIYSHSLKGSLREHFVGKNTTDGSFMDTVFGKTNKKDDKKTEKKEDEGKSGDYLFMQAHLLSIPIRSGGDEPFFHCTSDAILSDLWDLLINVVGKKKEDTFCQALKTVVDAVGKYDKNIPKALILNDQFNGTKHLEDIKNIAISALGSGNTLTELLRLFELNTLVLPATLLQKLTDNHHLPVIARNHLENGQSTNLWYEQILPRQTKFYSVIFQTEKHQTVFENHLTTDLIQIGANATVGYGYSKFKKIN